LRRKYACRTTQPSGHGTGPSPHRLTAPREATTNHSKPPITQRTLSVRRSSWVTPTVPPS
jgi:hypothetical protein